MVALKTVLEVKSAEGFLRNRIPSDRPPLPPWITCCSWARDCLPRHHSSTPPGQQSSTSTTAGAAEQHATSDPPSTLDTGHRTPDTEHQGSTAARDHGSTGAGQHGSRSARQHGSTAAREQITQKTHQKKHDKTSTNAARQQDDRSEGAEPMTE